MVSLFGLPNSTPILENKSLAKWKKSTFSALVLSSTFYSLQMVSQRILGLLRIHSGFRGLVTAPVGFMVTASTIYASVLFEQKFKRASNDYELSIMETPLLKLFDLESTKADQSSRITKTFLGLNSFLFFEQSSFRSVFPSSVISLGSLAQLSRQHSRSLIATGKRVSESQRAQIQKLGKRFGCHHCGNRQLISRQIFIGDHMPPTKMAIELSSVWWRKLLGIKIEQRLWPQCKNCWSIQGSAVNQGKHVLVYHNASKLHHFAPILGCILADQKFVKEPINRLIDDSFDFISKLLFNRK